MLPIGRMAHSAANILEEEGGALIVKPSFLNDHTLYRSNTRWGRFWRHMHTLEHIATAGVRACLLLWEAFLRRAGMVPEGDLARDRVIRARRDPVLHACGRLWQDLMDLLFKIDYRHSRRLSYLSQVGESEVIMDEKARPWLADYLAFQNALMQEIGPEETFCQALLRLDRLLQAQGLKPLQMFIKGAHTPVDQIHDLEERLEELNLLPCLEKLRSQIGSLPLTSIEYLARDYKLISQSEIQVQQFAEALHQKRLPLDDWAPVLMNLIAIKNSKDLKKGKGQSASVGALFFRLSQLKGRNEETLLSFNHEEACPFTVTRGSIFRGTKGERCEVIEELGVDDAGRRHFRFGIQTTDGSLKRVDNERLCLGLNPIDLHILHYQQQKRKIKSLTPVLELMEKGRLARIGVS